MFDQVVAEVSPDDWDAPSPCEDWSARDVAGHVIGGQRMIESLAKGEGRIHPPGTWADLAGPDPAQAWRDARDAANTAITDDVMQMVVPSPFGEMALDMVLGIMVLDIMVHAWDLGRAAGIDVRLDADLVSESFARVRPMDIMIRQPGVFGPKVTPPADADEQTRFLAFLGRTV
jgi:uncharacterized protein (TIGR03086 family)